jgi:hypothetical protein
MRTERRITRGRALLILLTLWALAVIVPDLGRVFGDYGTLGFEADNDGRIYRVSGQPAKSADIHEDDRIDLKKTPFADRLAVFGGMGGMQYVRPGHEVHLYVRTPRADGSLSDPILRALRAVPHPLPASNRLILFLDTLGGIFFILVAAALVWQRPNAMTWGFFLYGMWFNPGQFFAWYAELQRWPYALLAQEAAQAIAQGAGYAGFVAFALRFPHNAVAQRWRTVERLLPFLAGALMVLQLLGFGTALGYPTEWFGWAFYIVGYGIDFFVLFILHVKRKSQPPEDRQRTRWVQWGCWVGLLAFIIADSNEATILWDRIWQFLKWHPSEVTFSFLYLINTAVPLAVFHAVRKDRVIDVRFACSRATTLFLTWGVIGVILAGVSVLIEEHLPFHDQIMVFIAIVVVIKLTMEQLHERLNEACDHLFFRHLVEAEERLHGLAASLATGNQCESIDDRLSTDPTTCLRLKSAAVFRRQNDGTYRQTGAVGWTDKHAQIPALPSALIRKVETAGKPIRLHLDDLHEDMPKGTALPVLAIPVIGREGLLAVALYGAHEAGDDLTADEVAMLQEFGRAAVSGYECVEVLTQRRRIEELEAQVQSCCRSASGEDRSDLSP